MPSLDMCLSSHVSHRLREVIMLTHVCVFMPPTCDGVVFLRDKAVNIISLLSDHLEH